MKQRLLRGIQIPSFFYGTAWKEDRTRELVEAALAAGFVAFDTANQRKHYHEAGVGEALSAAVREGKIQREALFLQTKFTYVRGQDQRLPFDPTAPLATQVQQSFTSSLAHLETAYVDSYVLHGPETGLGLTAGDWEVWRAMECLHAAGKTRFLGISNVNLRQLEALCEQAEVKPAFVQNRCYARTRWDAAIRAFCLANDISYQGFSLLTANAGELKKPDLEALARRKGRPVSAVVFGFALRVGMIPLTGTSSSEHMREDLAAFDLELSDVELALIEGIGGG